MRLSLLVLGLGAVIVAAVIVIPMLVIWSLNTLFGLQIVLTRETWAAALVLSMLVGQNSVVRRRDG